MSDQDHDADSVLIEALSHAKMMASLTDKFLRHALAENLSAELPMSQNDLDVLLFATCHTLQMVEAAEKLFGERLAL